MTTDIPNKKPGRPAKGPEEKRINRTLRAHPDTWAAFDACRGPQSSGTFLETLVALYSSSKLRGR